MHPRRPRTPLRPHSHPSDAPTTARPQRSRHPLPHRSTPKPQSHPTPPPLQNRTSYRVVGHPGHSSPTTRHPHPQSGRPKVGPPLGTRSPHGRPALHPGDRPGRPPTRPAATPPGDHPPRLQRRPGGSPPHSTLPGSRVPQRPRHTGTHGGLGQTAQGHEELPPPAPFGQQPGRTAMANRPPETVRKLADLTRSHAKANMQTPAEPPLRDPGQQATHPFIKPHAPPAPPPPVPPKRARQKRGAPAPSQATKAATSKPPAPPPTHPANLDQASSSSSLPSLPPPHPDQASSSSSLSPPAQPPPKAYPGLHKGEKVQQPFRNDHTGD